MQRHNRVALDEYEVRAATATTDRVCDHINASPNAVPSGSLSPTGSTAIGIVVAIAVIAIIAAVYFMRRGGSSGSVSGRDTAAFENPMYADTSGTFVANAGGAVDDGAQASGGYQDVNPDFSEGLEGLEGPVVSDGPSVVGGDNSYMVQAAGGAETAAYMDVNPSSTDNFGGFDNGYGGDALYDSATGASATAGYMDVAKGDGYSDGDEEEDI